jgi:hypothetical protein
MKCRTRTTWVVAAALSLALVATGLATGSVAADRKDAVDGANAFIEGCFEAGGDPEPVVTDGGETVAVLCLYPDGSYMYCQFYPTQNCTYGQRGGTRPGRAAPPLGGTLGGAHGGAAPDPGGTATPTPTATRAATRAGAVLAAADDDRP